jgi:hypothetical protein
MLSARHRQVRTLHVKCTQNDQARRVRTLLEDALRTASLGDEGRLVLVRRVDLGAVALDGATSLSLKLERRMRTLVASAVVFSSEHAARAEVVWFPDLETARIELAARLVSSTPASAWFWRAAIPELPVASAPSAALRVLFRLLAEDGLAPTARLARRLARVGRLGTLLDALDELDVPERVLRQDAPRSEAGSAPPLALHTAPAGTVARSLGALARAFVQRVGTADRRARWLTAVLATENALRAPAAAPDSSERFQPRSDPGAGSDSRDAPQRGSPELASALVSESPAPELPAGARPDELAEDAAALAIELVDRKPTCAAGLLFALALLERLGLPDLLALQSRPCVVDLARRVLARIADGAAVPLSDPMRAAIERAEAPAPPGGERSARALVAVFVRAARRSCRRGTGMPLRALVLRPGRISITATHIDVFLALDQVDVSIRRAGLDLDPGYVPWLDRVVQFHYGAEGEA